MKEVNNEKHQQKEQLKQLKLQELQKQLGEKIRNLERKFQDKDQAAASIKMAMEEFIIQKRELKILKKQEQESNLRRHRRV